MPDHPTVEASSSDTRATAAFDAPAPGSAAVADIGPQVYDARTLAELETIFGRAKLMDLLGRLRVEIEQRLRAPQADRATLAQDAHTLLSVSGSLGFVDLSRRCTEMEQACLLGTDLEVPLQSARDAAARAIAAIDAIVSPA